MLGKPPYPENTMFIGCSGRLFWIAKKDGSIMLFEILGEGIRIIHVY
jgi:hypothetical protein